LHILWIFVEVVVNGVGHFVEKINTFSYKIIYNCSRWRLARFGNIVLQLRGC
jgi:hypothetical protein